MLTPKLSDAFIIKKNELGNGDISLFSTRYGLGSGRLELLH